MTGFDVFLLGILLGAGWTVGRLLGLLLFHIAIAALSRLNQKVGSAIEARASGKSHG
ncbi:hypothetical protein [Alteraurantiacibacter palmitatis]|uniref:Uncharacterized protein n=1 Tax=Alteraurantiacibacter palmitatis TaxID=2054628 RepID=A0ABV7E6Z5_9SPHN